MKNDRKVIFRAEIYKKIIIVIYNESESEETLKHKTERPSNYFSNSFTHYQAERIKKGVICFQILLEIPLIEHCRVHFQG